MSIPDICMRGSRKMHTCAACKNHERKISPFCAKSTWLSCSSVFIIIIIIIIVIIKWSLKARESLFLDFKRKRNEKVKILIWALALCHLFWWRANAWDISFIISTWQKFYSCYQLVWYQNNLLFHTLNNSVSVSFKTNLLFVSCLIYCTIKIW